MIVNYFLLSYLRLFSSLLCIRLKEEYMLLFFILPLKPFTGRMPIWSQLKCSSRAAAFHISEWNCVELVALTAVMNSALRILCRYSFTSAAILKVFYQKSHYIEKFICLHILRYPCWLLHLCVWLYHTVLFTGTCTKWWKSQGFVDCG